LHQAGNLFELNVKLRCQKVNGAIPLLPHMHSWHAQRLYLFYIPFGIGHKTGNSYTDTLSCTNVMLGLLQIKTCFWHSATMCFFTSHIQIVQNFELNCVGFSSPYLR